jgi:4-hydroxybenzoate polyprenyltransferase
MGDERMTSMIDQGTPSKPPMALATTIRDYLELIRFSHTIFALPFAILTSVWAWLLTARNADTLVMGWKPAVGILVCMVSARSFAMAVNRLADAKLDAQNPRTAKRHIPAGRLSYRGVVVFSIVCALAFVAGTFLFYPNRLPSILALPVLVFLAGYSFAKRFTVLVHFWLGIALALAPICAWVALRGEITLKDPRDLLPAGLVGLGVLLWVAGFDVIYATQDAEVDRALGLKSLPARLGVAGALRVAATCHALMIVPFAALPWLCPEIGLGGIFVGALILVAILLIYEHSIVSDQNLASVNVAFFHANAVISSVMLVAGIWDAWLV